MLKKIFIFLFFLISVCILYNISNFNKAIIRNTLFDRTLYNELNERDIYSFYRSIYRESIYSESPNMTFIIIMLKTVLQMNINNINIYIDIIRLYSIAYRRTLKKQICGDISESPYQMYTYYKYVSNLKTTNARICEIGFLFGVSSLTFFLATGISSKYIGFDYGHPQSKYIFSLLEHFFHMKMIWGKSQDTVPLFNESIKCDVIHIDGNHDSEMIYIDINNMKRLSNYKSLLIIDDINSYNNAWIKSVDSKIIEEILCSKNKSFCIGRYVS